MKFVLQVRSSDTRKEIKSFLLKVYSGKDPEYCSVFFPDPEICLDQLQILCDIIKAQIKKINPTQHLSLNARVETLYTNIAKHINNYEGLSRSEKTNTLDFCKIGKRCLETITYNFIHYSGSQTKSLTLISAFLYEDQIALCMGGILSIVQDYASKFTYDANAEITNACMSGIKAAAKRFIDQLDLLHFTNEDGVAVRTSESLARTHEIHYINHLFNHITQKFTFLEPITDAYTKLFPIGGWDNLFKETLNENDLVEFYLQYVTNDLPELPLYFDLTLYTHFCTLLDSIGTDPTFYIYVENDDGSQTLKANHLLALRATITKRLINKNTLQCSEQDKKYTFYIGATTYDVYLFGNPRQHWIERIDKYKDHTFISFSDAIPRELIKAIGNSQDCEMQESILRAAAAHNNIFLLDMLYHSDTDINCKDSQGRTPLMHAIIHGSLESIKIISNHARLEINQQDFNKYSALMLAVEFYSPAVPILLKHAAINTELKNFHHKTALHIAVSIGNKDATVALIKDTKVNVNTIDKLGYDCLRMAAIYNRSEIATILLTRLDLDINHIANDGLTALHAAIAYNNIGFMKLLLSQQNIDINIKGKHSKTPLMLAIEQFRNTACEILLHHERIDLNIQDIQGRNAMAIAKKVNNKNIFEKLSDLAKLHKTPTPKGRTTEPSIPVVIELDAGGVPAIADQHIRLPSKQRRFGCGFM